MAKRITMMKKGLREREREREERGEEERLEGEVVDGRDGRD